MKYAFSFVLFLCLSLIASAGETEFKSSTARSAKQRYERAVERAKQKAVRDIEIAKKAYQATLDREMKTATRRADLDEANMLSAEKKKLDNPVRITVDHSVQVAVNTQSKQGLVGQWNATHESWKGIIAMNEDGTFSRRGKVEGRWILDGKSLTLDWTKWPDEILQLQEDGSFSRESKPKFKMVKIKD